MCDDDGYDSIVKSMAKDAARGDREKEIERVFGEAIPRVLRRMLHENGGTKRAALRQLNDRLERSDSYDHESNGKVSPNTFYDWLDRYDGGL